MRVAAAALLAVSAWGQGGLEGVRSGALFDAPARAVRVVEGVPGAAHLGGVVAEGVEAAWLSPAGGAALVKTGGEWFAVRGLGREDAERRELGVEVAVARWSANGRYVAVAGAEFLGVWDGEAMEWVARPDLGEGREVADVAVTDSGELWVSWHDGESSWLEAWRDGQWQEMGRAAGRAKLAVQGGVAVLAGAGEAVLLGESGETGRVSTGRNDAPAGVELSGGMVVAAYGGESPELMWWKPGGALQRLSLDFSPERVERLAGGQGLVLKRREKAGDEIWVAVWRDGQWAVFFVPAGDQQ
jgi:hypothetical protein